MKINVRKIVKLAIITVPILIIGIVILISVNNDKKRFYSGYQTVAERELSPDMKFYGNDGRLYLISKNGTKALDRDGGLAMDVGYELDDPMVVSAGNVAAIADINGDKVYVISSNGIPYSYKTDWPIVKICVAKDGTTAVLMDNGTKDIIRLYSMEGECRVEIGTKGANDGFPVDIALSDDGKKLATLYISFSGDNVQSKVTFYNTGSIGKNFIENIVGQKIYTGELAYSLQFLGNDRIGVIFKDGFSLYSMPETPELLTDKKNIGTIKDITMCDDLIAVMVKENNGDKILVYDTNGALCSEVTGIPETKSMTAMNGEIILLNSDTLIVYRKNGTEKTRFNIPANVTAVYSASDQRYYMVGHDKAQTINLKK